jgi:hypothetical protein
MTPMAEADGSSVKIDISPGELIDKITILEIKSARIRDAAKLVNIRHELKVLSTARDGALKRSPDLDRFTQGLKTVNETLWDIEDKIRLCERDKNFGPDFIALARAVYHNNDERAALKRKINDLLGAALVEEKSYEKY